MADKSTIDDRFFCWNLFMLHLLNEWGFERLNSDPSLLEPGHESVYYNQFADLLLDVLAKAKNEETDKTKEFSTDQVTDLTVSPIDETFDKEYNRLSKMNQLTLKNQSVCSNDGNSNPDLTWPEDVINPSPASSVKPISRVIARPVRLNDRTRSPSSGFASVASSSETSPILRMALPSIESDHSIKPKPLVCNFCRNNGEVSTFYSSHTLKDSSGNVICPVLSAHVCEACGATGANAHTRSYCPHANIIRTVFNNNPTVLLQYTNFATSSRPRPEIEK